MRIRETAAAPICIACQGAAGAYSGRAAKTLFPSGQILYFENFESVLIAVNNGLCDYGILPVRNSYAGEVAKVRELLDKYRPEIVDNVKLKVEHSLLTLPGVMLGNINEVYSHPQALRQCSEWLKEHPWIEVKECANTAVASRMVSCGEVRTRAAISSDECAALYGLISLEKSIQNESENTTEFVCIKNK